MAAARGDRATRCAREAAVEPQPRRATALRLGYVVEIEAPATAAATEPPEAAAPPAQLRNATCRRSGNAGRGARPRTRSAERDAGRRAAPAWSVDIAKIEVNDGGLTFADQGVNPPADIAISGLAAFARYRLAGDRRGDAVQRQLQRGRRRIGRDGRNRRGVSGCPGRRESEDRCVGAADRRIRTSG